MKSGNAAQDLKSLMLTKNGGQTYEFEGQTIIYCRTKKAAEEVENVCKCKYFISWRRKKCIKLFENKSTLKFY